MTKVNSIIKPPPIETLYNPYIHYVKPVSKVDIDKSGSINIVYAKEPIVYTNFNICCNDDISGKVRDEILREELQLHYEAWVVTDILRKQNRSDEVAAIFIDVAKRSETLALKYASLYKGDDNKNLAMNLILKVHTYLNYGRALSCLKRIIVDPIYTDKRLLANMLLTAHGKLLATTILMKNDGFITRAKNEGREIDQLLISMGLGDLIDKHARVESVIETKQDSFLPSFAPIATLGDMVSRMFRSNDSEQDSAGSDSSTEIKPTIRNKRNID